MPRERAWDVALCAGISLAVGAGPVLTYSFGVFVKPIADFFGVSVAEVAAIPGVAMILSALLNPLVGSAADRFGPRWIMLIGTVVYGSTVVLFGMTPNIRTLTMAYLLAYVGAIGVGAGVWYSFVARSFTGNRGLALGVCAAISGIGVAANPVLATQLIARYGWQGAIATMGTIVFLVNLPMVLWALHARSRGPAFQSAAAEASITLRELWERVRTVRLAKIGGIIFFGNIAVGALVIHLPAYLSAHGASNTEIAAVAGTLGVSSIVARLCFGALIDRVYAPWVCACAFFLPVVAIALLLSGPPSTVTALIAAVLIGATLGSEGSDAPYLVAAAFDPKSHATMMGLIIGTLAVGMGVGPLVVSQSLATLQQYEPGLICIALTSVCSSALALSLGWKDLPYYPATQRQWLFPPRTTAQFQSVEYPSSARTP